MRTVTQYEATVGDLVWYTDPHGPMTSGGLVGRSAGKDHAMLVEDVTATSPRRLYGRSLCGAVSYGRADPPNHGGWSHEGRETDRCRRCVAAVKRR